MTFDIAAGELPPGDAVKCGNRRDLPKKQRRHDWQQLGPDVRHVNSGELEEVLVRACGRCGADDYHRP